MARGCVDGGRVDDLSDQEIERLEARLFCAGGPPDVMGPALQLAAARMSEQTTAATPKR